MAVGEEPADRSILPLVRGSDWHRPSPAQVRSMSKTFAIFRGPAGFGVFIFFLMLWPVGPTPPGALIACYIALLNVAVALDGVVGATASAFLFIVGFGALG